jgi:REP element-mobilizing transposase RayT
MPNYRRAFVPGGCWFFTVNLLERRQTQLVDHIATLREAVAKTRQSQPYTIDAFVVLPDHLHAIWTCRRAMPISRPVGGSSRAVLRGRCRSTKGSAPFGSHVMNAASGSGDSGST